MTSLKKLARAQVIGLAVVVALVSYDITFPAGKTSAGNWKFAVTHPTVLLHIITASAVLILGFVLLIKSFRALQAPWILLSAAGLIFLLVAWAAGEDYVMTLHNSALNLMSIGWLLAMASYGLGWYLGHRQERGRDEQVKTPSPARVRGARGREQA
jgi:hypothetical protein